MANAAVFPVPVCAQPSKSRFFSTIGMACCCMGVGVVYPSVFKALRMGSIKFKFSNDMYISNVLTRSKNRSERIFGDQYRKRAGNYFLQRYNFFEVGGQKSEVRCPT